MYSVKEKVLNDEILLPAALREAQGAGI